MPRPSYSESDAAANPRRYVRLDGLGHPHPAPELAMRLGSVPAKVTWRDNIAPTQYRAAINILVDAALHRHRMRISRLSYARLNPGLNCWLLQWQHYLKEEAKRYGDYKLGGRRVDSPLQTR